MNRDFFKLLDPMCESPVKGKQEIYCTKVHEACKELREELGTDNHFVKFTKENKDRIYEVAYREEVNPILLMKILFAK